jgi:phage shock protein A
MKLLQRVTTLIRANLNDLIDRAEDPEKMIKQLVDDLNNQLIQVKTTVAQALADLHLLEKRLATVRDEAAATMRRAEMAVDRGNDALAKAALERHNSLNSSAQDIEKNIEIQRREVDDLKLALVQLETRIAEVTRSRDTLLARHRRAVAKEKLTKVNGEIHPQRMEELLDAIAGYVDRAEAKAQAVEEIHQESANRKLTAMEADARLEEQLGELKARRQGSAAA